jgi:alpha-beta hydrolase superfamily lysophospholipase
MAATRDLTTGDGSRVRLHERVPAGATEAVLFVHGATYAGGVVFDLDVPSAAETYSWLDATADRGRAAAAVDLRGYGDSERPPAMDEPPDANPPPARADDVLPDVRVAIDALRDRVDRVHVLGYSWGSIICGRLLARDDAPTVASLTQFAPVFRMDADAVERFDPGDPAPAYRTQRRPEVAERWNDQIPGGVDPAVWRGADEVGGGGGSGAGDGGGGTDGGNGRGDGDGGDDRGDGDAGDDDRGDSDRGNDDPVFEAYWSALRATAQATDDGGIAAPNGTLLDMRAIPETAPYDPAAIDAPVLVVRGSADPTATRADSFRLYDALGAVSGARGADRGVRGSAREYAEIGGGTHFLPMERRRGALYDSVDAFHDRVGD